MDNNDFHVNDNDSSFEEKENEDGVSKEEHVKPNDVHFEEEIDESENHLRTSKKDKTSKLKAKLEALKKEKQEYLDGWQRARAELSNANRRNEEDKQAFKKYAKENIIQELIPVMDSFDMAFSNKKAWEDIPKEWRVGVESIYSQLYSVLTSNNVTRFDPTNEAFDPERHEAIEVVETEDKEKDNIILEVVQSGYELNDKIIRTAKVRVGKVE